MARFFVTAEELEQNMVVLAGENAQQNGLHVLFQLVQLTVQRDGQTDGGRGQQIADVLGTLIILTQGDDVQHTVLNVGVAGTVGVILRLMVADETNLKLPLAAVDGIAVKMILKNQLIECHIHSPYFFADQISAI